MWLTGTPIIIYYGENKPLVQLLAWSRCDIIIYTLLIALLRFPVQEIVVLWLL